MFKQKMHIIKQQKIMNEEGNIQKEKIMKNFFFKHKDQINKKFPNIIHRCFFVMLIRYSYILKLYYCYDVFYIDMHKIFVYYQ